MMASVSQKESEMLKQPLQLFYSIINIF